MEERQIHVTSDILYALAFSTITEEPSQDRSDKEIIEDSIWRGNDAVMRSLFAIRKRAERSEITQTQSYEITRAMQNSSNRSRL